MGRRGTTYMKGPDDDLLALQNPGPRQVDLLKGEHDYEEITPEEYTEIAASRLNMEAEGE